LTIPTPRVWKKEKKKNKIVSISKCNIDLVGGGGGGGALWALSF